MLGGESLPVPAGNNPHPYRNPPYRQFLRKQGHRARAPRRPPAGRRFQQTVFERKQAAPVPSPLGSRGHGPAWGDAGGTCCPARLGTNGGWGELRTSYWGSALPWDWPAKRSSNSETRDRSAAISLRESVSESSTQGFIQPRRAASICSWAAR